MIQMNGKEVDEVHPLCLRFDHTDQTRRAFSLFFFGP